MMINKNEDYEKISIAVKSGEPIILPTDTNYNLACDPKSKQAIDTIFLLKQRNKNKPLSLFFLNPNNWRYYGKPENERLMELLVQSFWPGPLNIVVPKKDHRYDYMINGGETIALGCIRNKTWRDFMQYLNGEPIALTSANVSGYEIEMVTKEIAMEQMGDKVSDFLLSEEKVKTRKSSTIVSIETKGVRMLRQGDITDKMIKEVIKENLL